MSRSTHKWYPISGTHKDSKCSRNDQTSGSILENSLKWYHTFNWYPTIGINHAKDGSTSDPQL